MSGYHDGCLKFLKEYQKLDELEFEYIRYYSAYDQEFPKKKIKNL